MTTTDLERKLRNRTAKVAVVGLGYAGLPMAVEIARAGFPVVGYDVDAAKTEAVNDGLSPVSNVAAADVEPLVRARTLRATTDPADLDSVDVTLICVPTPLTQAREPDLTYVLQAGRTLGERLRPGQLVILQSTCAPGTTGRVLRSTLEEISGLKAGADFLLVFAPERIDPGNNTYTVANTPKLVGGTTEESTRLACLLYRGFIDDVVEVSSPEVAEMAKLVENTFRFINISFVNEIALLCDRLGVNVWEVIEAAKTKPFAFMPHYPSPGVGGHCIPVVPHFLSTTAAEHGLVAELIQAAARVNDAMPGQIVDKLEAALATHGKQILGANVLVVGVTYKPDISDVRESAAISVLEATLARGARAAYHDPLTPSLTLNGLTAHSVPLTAEEIAGADAVLLLTPHSTVDYDLIVRTAALVVDTHNGLHPRVAPNVVNVWVPSAKSGDPVRVA